MMDYRTPYTFDRVVRIVFTVIGILGALYLLDVLKAVLLPFMVACLMAYILEPVVKFNMRVFRLKSRFLPVVLTLLEALALLTIFCMIFIPYLIHECREMVATITKYATTQIHIPYVSERIHDFIRDNINLEEISRWMSREEWIRLTKQTLSSSWNFVSSSVAFIFGVVSWVIVFLYLIFIMLDYERLMLSFRQLVPYQHRHRVFHIFDDVKNAMNRYFRGQFVIAMSVGVLFAIGFLIIRRRWGWCSDCLSDCSTWCLIYRAISLPVTAVLCVVAYVADGVDFWVIFWESMAVYVVVQCIQDLILTPKIMGKAMGLNPAIILLSLSVWGSLLGFLGLIIALPLTTLLLSYYDLYVVQRIRRKQLLADLREKRD